MYFVITIGYTPDGEALLRWTEPNGSVWEEFWATVPGGGLIQTRQI